MITNLASEWRYSTEDDPQFANLSFNDTTWSTMSIPANWFMSGLDHHGVVWFRHEFRQQKNTGFSTLHFDGVDYSSDVYLNGIHLGHHIGYFDPFNFEVTDKLRAGKNILAVRVESPYESPGPNGWHMQKKLIKGVLNHHDCRPGGGWEPVGQSFNTGGIWNRVYLAQHGEVTIDRLLLNAEMDAQSPIIKVEVTLQNRSRKLRTQLEILCSPENFKGRETVARFKLEIPAGISVHPFQISIKDIHLWQPWDRGFPHLYKVSASLNLNRESVSRSSLFGFRTVNVESGFRWFINGKPYFPRGSNYLPSQWLSETIFPEVAGGKKHPFGGSMGGDFFSGDVALAKKANLNFLRVHAHVLPPAFHEACDRAGMLVWQDFPFQWGYSDDPGFQAEAERQLHAMIIGWYNHPSIAAWCCHNESPWDAPWMAGKAGEIYNPAHNRDLDSRLEAIASGLDPHRYVHRNSGTGDGHVYPGWYVGHWRDFSGLPGAPFITEYGAQGLPVRKNLVRTIPNHGGEAGYTELVSFKNWLDSRKKITAFTKLLIRLGTGFWNLTEKNHWKFIQNGLKGWGIKFERSAYRNIPSAENTPENLRHARDVWETWRFHNFQPAETFDNGITLGGSLDQFIANSQGYQEKLIQFATESYRLAKYGKVTGIFQFDFSDPWPAITWSVVDYWRTPKPAYDALRRSMQPVLPCFRLPENMEAGKAILVTFCVVNDLLQPYPISSCEWHLEGEMGVIASAAFPVDIPADGISSETKITLPAFRPGKYKLFVIITSSQNTLGENRYELVIQ